MTRVAVREQRVYRHAQGRRHFLTESGAYFDLAKRMILAKYPRDLVSSDDDFEGGAISLDLSQFGMTPALAEIRRSKAQALYWREGPRYEPDGDWLLEFDPDRWRYFVGRVARFLRYVDRRRA